MPGSVHSGSVHSQVAWACFQIGSHTMPGQCLVTPCRHYWVKGVFVFWCNLPPVLLAEWPGSFTCHCGNTGVEWTPNKSQHTKLTLERKILLPLLPGFILPTWSRVRHSNQWPILVRSGSVSSCHIRCCQVSLSLRVVQSQTWSFQVVMSDTIMSSQALLCHIMSGHTG